MQGAGIFWRRLIGVAVAVVALATFVRGELVVPAEAATPTAPTNYAVSATNCKTITFDQWVNQGDTVTVTFDSTTYAGPSGSYCMAGINGSVDPAVASVAFTGANGQPVTPAIPGNWQAWPNGTLVITAVGSGTFNLAFADAFTGVNSAFRFFVRVHPAAPTTPAVSLSDTTATISTGRSDSGVYTEPTAFLVTAAPGGATCTFNPGVGETSCQITGLTPGTTYTFTATASNSAGVSDPSSASAGVTPPVPATVPDAPTGLQVTGGNASASIAFTAGSDGGSPITNYEFSLNGGTWVAFNPTVTASPVLVTGLTNLTRYAIRIRAVNAVGSGADSLPVSVTPRVTPEKPSITTVVGGDRSVTVSVVPAGTGPVATSYTVSALPGGATCVVSDPAGGSCVVRGLTNGTPYTFSAVASNAAGDSDPTAASPSVTPESARPQPQPLPEPLGPGGSVLQVDGRLLPVTVTPTSSWSGLQVTGPGFEMSLDGLNSNGRPLGLAADGVLILHKDRQVQTSGKGFRASSEVDLFIDPPVAVRARSNNRGIYVGTVVTDAGGSFAGRVTLPLGLSGGQHTLQAVGQTRLGAIRSLSLGVLVRNPVMEAPGGVRRMSVSVASPRSAVISWSRPTAGGGARYVVTVSSAGQPGMVFRAVSGALSQTVEDLVPGCPYVVEVTAINEAGRGATRVRSFIAGMRARSVAPMGDIACIVR